MGLIAWIIVGSIAGWLAEQFTGREHGLLKNLIVGVVGAIVGGAVFTSLLGFNYYRGLNLATIFVATVGAVDLSLRSRLAARPNRNLRPPPLIAAVGPDNPPAARS